MSRLATAWFRLQTLASAHARWITLAVLGLDALVLAAWLLLPERAVVLAPASVQPSVQPTRGHAFVIRLQPASFPFSIRHDGEGHPLSSRLTLTEDGVPIGPAHAQHERIRQTGQGAFSHWEDVLYFSSSDGSDPRANGRNYRAVYPLALAREVIWILLFVNVCYGLLFWTRIAAWIKGHPGPFCATVSVVPMAVLGLAAADWTLPINPHGAAGKDAALIMLILWHAALGAALAAAFLGAGAGLCLLLTRRRKATPAQLVLGGYPLALAFSLLLIIVARKLPLGAELAVLLLIGSCLPLFFWKPVGSLVPLGRALALAAPLVLAFAGLMGLLWHGPTEHLAAAPLGDTTTFMARTLTHDVGLTSPNFALEGYGSPFGNTYPCWLAARLVPLPGFDLFLFWAVSGTVFFLGTLLVGLGSLCADMGRLPRRLPPWVVALAGGLILAAVRYPSWIVESAPVPFFEMLVLSVYYLKRKTPQSALAAAVLGSALTKVMSLIVFLPYVAWSWTRSLPSNFSRQKLCWAVLAGAAVLAYGAPMLWTHLPGHVAEFLCGPDSAQVFLGQPTDFADWWPVAARDLGLICLAWACLGLGQTDLTLGVWAAVASFLALPGICYTAQITAVLLVALVILENPAGLARRKRWFIAALALLLPYPLLADPGGVQVGVLWLACGGLALWIIFAPVIEATPSDPARGFRRRLAWGSAGIVAMALLAASTGRFVIASGAPEDFTPAHRDIWLAVRQHTPDDALIFTDQTGPTADRLGGWNDYALLSQRQFFICSWSVSSLRLDLAKRHERLALNEDVLVGHTAPCQVPLSRSYSSYYAVVSRNRAVPRSFSLVYQNASFRLYRMEMARPDLDDYPGPGWQSLAH